MSQITIRIPSANTLEARKYMELTNSINALLAIALDCDKDKIIWDSSESTSEVQPHSVDVTGKVVIIADFAMAYGVSPDDKDYAATSLGVLKDYEETFVLQHKENNPDIPFCSVATFSNIKFTALTECIANEIY